MNTKIKFTDPTKDHRWDDYVAQHPLGSLYHTSRWMQVLQKSFGYQPRYAVMEDAGGNLCGAAAMCLVKSLITGNRMVALPFSDYCDVLLNDESDRDALFQFLIKNAIYLNAEYFELKAKQENGFYEDTGFRRINSAKNHILDIQCGSLEEIQKKFHKSYILRNIKKAQDSPLKIIKANTPRELRLSGDLLLETRKKHGLPPHPFSFLKNMQQFLKENLDVYLALDEGKAVATIVVASYKDTAYYLYGGSDSRNLRYRPNHLLLWTAIEKAWNEGRRFFDFGRSGLNNPSLMQFKRRWGTVESDLPSYWLSLNGKKSISLSRGKMDNRTLGRIIQSMPNPVLKMGSNLVYRHLA